METEGALIHFGVRGASRPLFHRERGALVLAFHSALRFAVVSDPQAAENAATGRNEFQSALRFAVVSDIITYLDRWRDRFGFNPL